MKTKDDILREAIKHCPGAMTSAQTLIGGVYDFATAFVSEFTGSDIHEYGYPNIPDKLERKLIEGLGISESETVYYVAYRNISEFAPIGSNNAYFVITTDRIITYIEDDKVYYSFCWENINSFGLNDYGCNLEYNGDSYELPLSKIIGSINANPEFQEWLITCIVDEVCNLQAEEQALIDADEQSWQTQMDAFLEDADVAKIKDADAPQKIAWLEKWESKLLIDSHNHYGDYLKLLTFCSINFALNIDPDNYTDDSWIADRNLFWSKIVFEYAKKYKAKNLDDDEMNAFEAIANIALFHDYYAYGFMHYLFRPYSDDFVLIDKDELRHWRTLALIRVQDDFLSYDYNDRRFLVIDSKISYPESKNFIVLPKNGLPEDLKFPLGHPQEGELYVCHPYNHNLYLPYESCEFELFKDKMDELRLVLQAMGATSIKIYEANDQEAHKNNKCNIAVDGSVNAKINKAHGEFKQEKELEEFEKLRREYETVSVFEPQRMPYIPDNLVWYPHQTDWQRLFEQRKGGLKRYRISISIAKEAKVSEQKRLALKADFQALILKMNASVNIDTESMFETKASSVWTLDVEFASLEDLRARENMANNIDVATIQPALTVAELTDEEQKYVEEIKFCIEDDDQIDAKERRMLERFRLRFGISEERAAELETMVLGSVEDVLSVEEQEYCDAVSDYIADGELSDSDLRLLARLASSLDISPEREKELQTKIIKSL